MSTLSRDGRTIPADWPHAEHSRFVTRGGIRWHVQIMGEGPVMLLVHGTGASSHSFRALMPLLSSRFTVVVPDLPGHAFTRAPPWFEPTLEAMAASLGELLAELDLRPKVTVGHSAGAAIIARMALDSIVAPDLLVGLGAALTPFRGAARTLFPPAARVLAAASKLVDLGMRKTASVERALLGTGSSLDAGGVELYRRLSSQPAHVAGVLAMMSRWELDSLEADLPRLSPRFLLVGGERDRAVPILQQSAAASRIPSARLVVVNGAGHLVHEEAPKAVAALILEASAAAAIPMARDAETESVPADEARSSAPSSSTFVKPAHKSC